MTEFDINKEFQNTVDPTGELAQSIKPPDIPDFFEPASSRPASEPAAVPGSGDAVAAEAAATPSLPAADPDQPSLPFDVGEAPAPEKLPAVRDPEPPKP